MCANHAIAGFFPFGTAHANTATSPADVGPVRHQANSRQETTLMKNLAFLSAAFALSFVLMASTVVVPLGTTSFVA